ncbi:hypothetical protein DICVIV_12340 [Dictyocaulus viviparus]|uniref:Uncharacterized protein n=1 Tax=Dictyocaulus viviparus TaxID=29172 RepID=A0A0D8XH81_DICVI|nr:hypothetical protein DICVIV_12340 [Dictyocaulus viviparus]
MLFSDLWFCLGSRRTAPRILSIDRSIAFVHISTAYANCDRPETEEKVYDPPVEPQKLLEAIQWMDNDMIALVKFFYI